MHGKFPSVLLENILLSLQPLIMLQIEVIFPRASFCNKYSNSDEKTKTVQVPIPEKFTHLCGERTWFVGKALTDSDSVTGFAPQLYADLESH